MIKSGQKGEMVQKNAKFCQKMLLQMIKQEMKNVFSILNRTMTTRI